MRQTNNKKWLTKFLAIMMIFSLLSQTFMSTAQAVANNIQESEIVKANEEQQEQERVTGESNQVETVESENEKPIIETEKETNQANAPPVKNEETESKITLWNIELEQQEPVDNNILEPNLYGGITSDGEVITYSYTGGSRQTRGTGQSSGSLGKYYGGYMTSTAYITIDGEPAWCIQPTKPFPLNVEYAKEVYNNPGVQNITYYATKWGWTQPNTDYVDVYVALNVYLGHFADTDNAMKSDTNVAKLLDKANKQDAPIGRFSFDKTSQKATVKNNQQETDWYTPNTDGTDIEYKVLVPDDIVKAVTSDGKTLGKGTHTLKQSVKFKYVAPLNYEGKIKFDVETNQKEFSALKFNPYDGYSQELVKGGFANDPIKVKNLTAEFEKREGYGKIKKLDDNGQPLAGAEFNIKGSDGSNVTKTTNAVGVIDLTYLHDVKLTITETKAPHLYARENKTETITIVAGETKSVTFTNKLQKGSSTIIKQDSETGNTPQGQASLNGAIYGVFKADGTLVKEVTLASKDGKVQGTVDGLAIETDYYWQEIKAPTGYNKNPEKIAFNIAYAGQDVQVATHSTIAKDDVINGNIDLMKFANYNWLLQSWNSLFGDDSPSIKPGLANVEFTIFEDWGDNKEFAKIVTDKQGYAALKDIPYGKYYMDETKTPVGYKKADRVYFEVTEQGQTFHYSIENKVIESKVRIVKVDADTGKEIVRSKAGYKIKSLTTGKDYYELDDEGNKVDIFYTNEKGILQLQTMFAFGEYEAKEEVAPENYVLAKEPVKFSVTGNEKDGVVIIRHKNSQQLGEVEITKTVETGNTLVEKESEFGKYYEIGYSQQALAGVKFVIRATKDSLAGDNSSNIKEGELVQYNGKDLVLTTDANGKVKSPVILHIGEYELVEIEAPAGVHLSGETTPFSIKYAGQSVSITSTSTKVENKLQAINVYGHKQQEIITGWENGQPVIELENANDGQVFALKIKNDLSVGAETLAGGSVLGYSVVKDGVVVFENLKLPNKQIEYYLQEVKASESYVLSEDFYFFAYNPATNDKAHDIHVWADSYAENKAAMTKIARNPIINKLARASVKLVKVDGLDEQPLENVPFNLVRLDEVETDLGVETSEDGSQISSGAKVEIVETVISKHATDANGEINLLDLPTGKYKLVETRPLYWYENNSEDLSFEINATNNGETIEIKATNHRKPLEIETLFATTVDGLKQINPDIDNKLTDYIDVKGLKEKHTYYVDTFYVNPATGKVVSQSASEVTGNGKELQKFETLLDLPKGTMKDGEALTATHIIYSDKEKTKEVGRHDKLDNLDQTVVFKSPKLTIKTKAKTANGSQLFTYGDVVAFSDDVEINHKDVLDGTKRAFETILVAEYPTGKMEDIWTSGKIDYVVPDEVFARTVVTEKIDTSKYPEGTKFFFKEIGYNEAGEEDTRHNFDGKDRQQAIYQKKLLPQTNEEWSAILQVVGNFLVIMVGCYFIYRKKNEETLSL